MVGLGKRVGFAAVLVGWACALGAVAACGHSGDAGVKDEASIDPDAAHKDRADPSADAIQFADCTGKGLRGTVTK